MSPDDRHTAKTTTLTVNLPPDPPQHSLPTLNPDYYFPGTVLTVRGKDYPTSTYTLLIIKTPDDKHHPIRLSPGPWVPFYHHDRYEVTKVYCNMEITLS